MLPLTFLGSLVALTVLALVGQSLERRRLHHRMRKLAAEWRLQFSPVDRFQLAPHVRAHFPIPGASDVTIADLLYRQEQDVYRYFFTVEYTQGVIRTKQRVRRAAMIAEPRDRAGGTPWSPLVLAPDDLPLTDQYAHLRQANS